MLLTEAELKEFEKEPICREDYDRLIVDHRRLVEAIRKAPHNCYGDDDNGSCSWRAGHEFIHDCTAENCIYLEATHD